jgi:thioredoxin-like negative regulator of GroEL
MSTIFEKKDQTNISDGLCIVEVSGESCANCFSLAPILSSLAKEQGERFVHVEAGRDTETLMKEWEVTKLPAVLLIDDGKIFARCYGYQPEEILSIWLEAKLKEHKTRSI